MSATTAEPPSRRPSAGRRTLEETRELLIATGIEMIGTETPVTIGRIDLIDVCRRAGLTSAGSAYKIWDTYDDYRVDLLHHVFAMAIPGREAIDLVTATIADTTSEGLPPLGELIRTATDTTASDDDPGARQFSVYVALLLAADDDPEIAAGLNADDTALIEAYARLYDQIAQQYEREWVEPLGPRLFATLVGALADGLTVRTTSQGEIAGRRLMRRIDDDGGEEAPWSLLASGVDALVQRFTRPRTGNVDAGVGG